MKDGTIVKVVSILILIVAKMLRKRNQYIWSIWHQNEEVNMINHRSGEISDVRKLIV